MEALVETKLNCRLIADYFIARDEERYESDVTQMKLHKLMYFAQANYLADTGNRLFDSDIFAFEHGPVVDGIYREFRVFGRSTIVVKDDDVATLAKDRCREIPEGVYRFLDSVWEKYGDYSASELRILSHKDAPWKDAYDPDSHHCLIDDAALRDYYRHSVASSERVHCDTVWFVDQPVWDRLEAVEGAI